MGGLFFSILSMNGCNVFSEERKGNGDSFSFLTAKMCNTNDKKISINMRAMSYFGKAKITLGGICWGKGIRGLKDGLNTKLETVSNVKVETCAGVLVDHMSQS